MSQTTNLQLNKHDDPSTNENQFDIENYLNANWDKIDETVGENVEDIETLQAQKEALEQEIQNLKEALEQEIQSLKEASYKVIGTGTDITLNNTSNNKFLQLDVKGNTEQTQLTGKNLFDKSNIVTDNRLSTTGGATSAEGYYISSYIPVIAGTTYTKNSPTADAYHRVCFYSSNSTSGFISASNDNTNVAPTGATYMRFCGLLTELDTTQLEEGSTATSYEPFCGGIASPNPEFPQPIYNVTGDVNIRIQNKNLAIFEKNNLFPNSSGVVITTNNTYNLILKVGNNSQLSITGDYSLIDSSTVRAAGFMEYPVLGSVGTRFIFNTSTKTVDVSNYNYVLLAFYVSSQSVTEEQIQNGFQVEWGTPTSYVAHQEQNLPFTLEDNNLFDKNEVTYNYYLNTQGTLESANNYCVSDYIDIQEGKSYYISARGTNRTKFYDENKQPLTSSYDVLSTETTFTAPTNAKYIRTSINYTTISLDTFIICEGTSEINHLVQRLYDGSNLADDGIHNKSKRVILDGTETWSQNGYATTTNTVGFLVTLDNIVLKNTDELGYLCNRFTAYGGSRWASDIEGIVQMGTKQIMIKINKSRLSSEDVAGFKTWLSNNNVIVEYELETEETETYTETQQEQYNAIKEAMSYYGQTHISSTSDEIEAKIDATAIGDLNLVIS